MKFEEIRAIVTALEGQILPNHGYMDAQHDILYLPWDQPAGPVAEALEAAGCHWDEETEGWALF